MDGAKICQNTLSFRTPLFPTQIGCHGDSVNELESPNIFCNRVSDVCERAKTGFQLGSMCATVEIKQRVMMRRPWEDPGMSMGSAGLFDTMLGGDRVNRMRGDSHCRHLNAGDSNMRQNAMAGIASDAYGRYGYRTVCGYEPWR